MKIKKELAKVGITPLNKITSIEKNILVIHVITNLVNTFPILNSKYYELSMKLYGSDMYRAKINSTLNKVNYFYKNKTIYFDETLCLENIDTNIIHECIHVLQDTRGRHNELSRIGLCEFNEYKVVGLGLNEFVLQYISQKTINQNIENSENIDYINSYVKTLLNEVIYILGEDLIVKSAINANEEFKEKFMNTFQEEEIYYQFTSAFDTFMLAKQQINICSKQKTEYNLKNTQDKLYNVFKKIQYSMFQKYFSTYIKYIDSIEEVDECRNKILEYRKLIKCNENEEEQYDKDIKKQLEILDKKFIKICQENSKNTLTVINTNAIIKLFNDIRKIFFKDETY